MSLKISVNTTCQQEKQSSLRITEIFKSLQGESGYQGFVTTFVRLTGCPLRCQYCDTAYAFKGGKKLSISDILQTVKQLGAKYVCVTGGEPLAQPGASILINKLAELGYKVSVETSGAFDIGGLDRRVKIVMDVKTPDSLESDKNLSSNIKYLKSIDEVKFVICSLSDFKWSIKFVETHLDTLQSNQILFSPSYQQVQACDLAQWALDANFTGKIQIQLHKYLWGETQGV